MQTLSTESLWEIAQSQIEPTQHDRHIELLRKNEQNQLTLQERQELANLRQATDQLMLRKTYAWSILRWRGQRVPTLKELPTPA